MIRLAMEIPTAFLQKWSPLCDLDFALAHRVLEDEVYASFYAHRPSRRELILDNSMHELGKPLSVELLGEAAARVHANIVIAPDLLGQLDRNLEWFRETYSTLGGTYKIGVVLCGETFEEREQFLSAVLPADVLCLPFREARLEWLIGHQAQIVRRWARIHLLGVSTLEELPAFSTKARIFELDMSVDTSKPIKWGLEKLGILGRPLRGAPTSSAELLSLQKVTLDQEATIYYNIASLRSYLV